MEIKIKYGKASLHVKGLEGGVEAVKDLYRMISGDFAIATAITPLKEYDFVEKGNTAQPYMGNAVLKPKEDFSIRERIPNNVIDVEKLDVKQAVTENALVRCPHCGQAHALVIKDNYYYLMRKNYENKEFKVVSVCHPDKLDKIVCPEGKYTEYFEDLQETQEVKDITDFVVDNNTELFCPICLQSDTFLHWKDAWEDPLHFFETDKLCEVCGGEVSISVTKNGNNNVICNKCKTEVIDGKPIPK